VQTLNLKKKKRFIGGREVAISLFAVILTTVGIKASDKYLNPKGQEVYEGAGCPPDMTQIISSGGNFCIDKYENSPSEDCKNINPGNQEQTTENLDISRCKPVSKVGNIPWRFISQNQAAVACAKAGKRLPTNKEWLAAALGTPDKLADWGGDDCNVAQNWGSNPGGAGLGKDCVSVAGVYDMIGNVWEWVEGTVYDGEYNGRKLPKKGYIKGVDSDALPIETDSAGADKNYNNDYMWMVNSGARGFARGGYWDNNSDAGQYAIYLESEPSFAGVGIGFRCVK